LAVGMMRNREMLRYELAEMGGKNRTKWLQSTWPAPFLLAGALPVAALIVYFIQTHIGTSTTLDWFANALNRTRPVKWGLDLGIFRAVFMILWLLRDTLYLQWMGLRRSRWPLGTGLLYLSVYYTSTSILLLALRATDLDRMPWGALINPGYIFSLDLDSWDAYRPLWLFVSGMQIAVIALFASLQYQERENLSASLVNEQP